MTIQREPRGPSATLARGRLTAPARSGGGDSALETLEATQQVLRCAASEAEWEETSGRYFLGVTQETEWQGLGLVMMRLFLGLA